MTPEYKPENEKFEVDQNTNQSPDSNSQSGLNTETIKQTANAAISQIKDTTTGVLGEQKESLTSGLNNVAQSIRQVSQSLRGSDESNIVEKFATKYSDNFANKLDDISSYVENADFASLANDLKSYARRQPALFIGGAFTLGLLAARFLKTSHPSQFVKETVSETIGGSKKQDTEFNSQGI